MTRSAFKKQMQLGLNSVFGTEYKRQPEVWRQYLDVETETRKAFVEDVMMAGLGIAPVKAEGAPVARDSTAEVYTARYFFLTVALSFDITEEAEEDGLYGSIGNKLARALARSMQQTKAIYSANLLNNGFDSNFPGGDGVALFSTSHIGGGSQAANMLSTPADLSETSLEDMLILISNATDHRDIPIKLEAMKLVLPNALMFTAQRLLYSQLRVDTANNDINAIKMMGMLSGGYVCDRNLTDTDAWFVKTDSPDGLKHIVRKPISKGVEGDFETGNMRYKSRERYVQGWSDWHGAYGTSGGGS